MRLSFTKNAIRRSSREKSRSVMLASDIGGSSTARMVATSKSFSSVRPSLLMLTDRYRPVFDSPAPATSHSGFSTSLFCPVARS